MITGIVTRSASGKGQLQRLVEAIMRVARQYDEDFLAKLDEYIVRLQACKGRFVVKSLNKLADKMAADML